MGSIEHATVKGPLKGLVVVGQRKRKKKLLHWYQRWSLPHLPPQITQVRARRHTTPLVRRHWCRVEVEVARLYRSSMNERIIISTYTPPAPVETAFFTSAPRAPISAHNSFSRPFTRAVHISWSQAPKR